ncbi:hypothetical protein [Myxacorys almedinensis]|uniref:Glutathione S-transferase n=1 Tax=Myxacorys almedinensis A TaxID=2690445 RepID=A0A8J7Z2D8_9CYAN|nr:hypothetical protein [Myxacorys almedinensis]NDJ16921.1 hypothetical protein [Myxacorys almedinensis A]
MARPLLTLALFSSLSVCLPAVALPNADDLPEEILRTEIILEARSPLDGKPLTAAEYAKLQAQLQTPVHPTDPRTQVSPSVQQTINLIKLRKFIKTVFPFIPIK